MALGENYVSRRPLTLENDKKLLSSQRKIILSYTVISVNTTHRLLFQLRYRKIGKLKRYFFVKCTGYLKLNDFLAHFNIATYLISLTTEIRSLTNFRGIIVKIVLAPSIITTRIQIPTIDSRITRMFVDNACST